MKNLLLLILVVLLAVVPLIFNRAAEFNGADGEAEEAITEINPDYTPWFDALWEPPSGEVESLLFVLQAAIGALFIGYFIGSSRMKRKMEEKAAEHPQ
ncbi:energy-coupling factor ABC transporter substrate-binding protein [Bacillus badius]|uniref:Cobalt transport protein CbiN n=1 Tax=Bacillus badius TaxID=1455 RepID=A0ABR5AWG4_BACBA|nr:energy-coupling factor ABC transporter substrate-binding protein [Bacillus badius]KIL74599.1 Additional substrate-specific component CbiN of cobalt ECF transporter [Bacillus badius]KIL79064.1 Additional substrate-specific component CbiN of cobalt ECF transporter [Bacillus badius]KZN99818.1 cobalt ABC transporter substrate-binding protein CbiN [Bacillus badius]MED0666612.1 energy-coupling factor ABC transporter substrate-binding protein [Bacillus badius]MED4715508.1 energy-coupling factor AB